jgi:hypothetical protein
MSEELEFNREIRTIKEEVKELLKRHAARLRRRGYSEGDINDIFEAVLDALPYEVEEVIKGARVRRAWWL